MSSANISETPISLFPGLGSVVLRIVAAHLLDTSDGRFSSSWWILHQFGAANLRFAAVLRIADRRADRPLVAAADCGGSVISRMVVDYDCSALESSVVVVLRVNSPVGAGISLACR